MALQNDPSLLFASTSGNVLPYTTLNNYPTSPSSITFTVDVSNSIGANLQIWNVGGTVNAVNGLYYQVFSTSDNVWYDTNEFYPPFLMPTVSNFTSRQTFQLATGKYQIQLTNTDPSNTINVMATTGNLV